MDSYERVLGCFYGAAIGDAMGAATETMTPQMILDRYGAYVDQLLAPGDGTFGAGCPAGFVTDDFSLAYFTALEILKAPDGPISDKTAQDALLNWSAHPEYFCFAGPSTSVAIKKILGEPVPKPPVVLACDNSRASNGSAMKIFPAGLKNPGHPERAVQDAITLCKPTHDNAASLSAACAIAAAVSAAVTGASLPEVFDAGFYGAREGARHGKPVSVASVEKRMELAISIARKGLGWEHTMLELGDVIGAGLSANEAVPCVFGILTATDADALSAIKMGVNIGNDTDTIATMVGAIAGAMHGASVFPEEMCKTVVSVNKMDIPAAAKAFTEVFYG